VYSWELYPATVAESHTHALDDLSDVDTGGVTDGDALVWDSGSSTWVPGTVAATLAGLTDVDLSGVADGDALVYDAGSSKWVPGTIATDPADDTQVWMPLTTVVGGSPELVWDADDSLIPTLEPL